MNTRPDPLKIVILVHAPAHVLRRLRFDSVRHALSSNSVVHAETLRYCGPPSNRMGRLDRIFPFLKYIAGSVLRSRGLGSGGCA